MCSIWERLFSWKTKEYALNHWKIGWRLFNSWGYIQQQTMQVFCGIVNCLSMFCPILQILLRLVYDLKRKGRPFLWTKVHEEALEGIKIRLLKAPVLHLLDNKGRFKLFSNKFEKVSGTALYQILKRVPLSAVNYSIKDLKQNYVWILANLNTYL